MSTRLPIVQQGRLHVAFWTVALLVIGFSAMSEPAGSPERQLIEGLLALAGIGLFVTSVTAFFAWLRRRRS